MLLTRQLFWFSANFVFSISVKSQTIAYCRSLAGHSKLVLLCLLGRQFAHISFYLLNFAIRTIVQAHQKSLSFNGRKIVHDGHHSQFIASWITNTPTFCNVNVVFGKLCASLIVLPLAISFFLYTDRLFSR
jgi:hypothetical protein